MYIKDLIPLHNQLRKPDIVDEFVLRIRSGRLFRGMKKPIIISRITATHHQWNGTRVIDVDDYYIHDGHHRIYSLYKCGVEKLMPCEYIMQDMSYQMYQDLAPHVGWVTPLDIRTHVRKPDFYAFKDQALDIHRDWNQTPNAFKEYVENNADLYLEPRTAYKIGDMIYKG